MGPPWHWDVGIYVELLAVAGGKERLAHFGRCIDLQRMVQQDGRVNDDVLLAATLADLPPDCFQVIGLASKPDFDTAK